MQFWLALCRAMLFVILDKVERCSTTLIIAWPSISFYFFSCGVIGFSFVFYFSVLGLYTVYLFKQWINFEFTIFTWMSTRCVRTDFRQDKIWTFISRLWFMQILLINVKKISTTPNLWTEDCFSLCKYDGRQIA